MLKEKFFFRVFDFATVSFKEIHLTEEYFTRYNNYLKKHCFNFKVEDAVAEYYLQLGKKVERDYASQAHNCDLIIEGNLFVEVKSSTDSLKYWQLEFIIENKGLVIWVLPLKESHNADIRDMANERYLYAALGKKTFEDELGRVVE